MEVFEKGNILSGIMLLGEAPGAKEDDIGVPFVGRAGQLLDDILDEVGLTYADLFFTNVVHTRPEGNRTPTTDEIKAGIPRLNRLISFTKPKIIVCLGGSASLAIKLALKQMPERIGKLAGTSQEVETTYGGTTVIYAYHPAAALHGRGRNSDDIRRHIKSTFTNYKELFERVTRRSIIQK